METVYIIGAGAIGQVLAVALAAQGREVVLLRGRAVDQARESMTIGVETPDGTLEAAVVVDSLQHHPIINGTVVLTSKSFGNVELAMALKGKTGDSPLVILQNGLDVEKPFVDEGFPSIYRCVLFATSQFTEDGRLRFKPVAPSPVGVVAGNGRGLEQLVSALHTPPFPFRAVADIRPVVWKKVIANCVFNSICPLLETDNGIFHRNGSAMNLAREVIAECVWVARLSGVEIGVEEAAESVLMISRLSDGQLISTLQDIRNRRPTEIEALNLAVAGKAAALQRAGDVLVTRLLGELTQLKSALNR